MNFAIIPIRSRSRSHS